MRAIARTLSRAGQQQGIVMGKAQAIGLTGPYLSQVFNDIWIGEIMATAAIEGERLDLDQVRSSVMRKLGLGDHGTSSRHVDGLVDVLHDANSNLSTELDLDRLCRWQSALFPGGTSGIKRLEVGKLRTFAEPMQIISGKLGKEKIHYQAPDSSQVEHEMNQFLDWFNRPNDLDGIVRAAIAHLWFETIHPFEDGNGRIGRAIIDMAIAQDTQQSIHLYSMARQLQKNRSAYYDQLNAAQKGDMDITAWIIWFIDQFSAACQQSEQHIDKAIEKAYFWSTHLDKSFNQRQRKTLQKLLDAGDGGFLGGLTADKYCKITGASKATATRDLTDLLQKGALITQDQGRATKYRINVLGWNQQLKN